MSEKVKSLIESFFQGLHIEVTNLTIEETEPNVFMVHLETPDSALVIGMHGAGMDSFRHLLGRIVDNQLQKHAVVHLEVNDYMKQHDEKLYRYLDNRVSHAMHSGQDVLIPNLSAYDRKKAHFYISEKNIEKLRTYSTGEGNARCLHIMYE